MKGVTGEFGRLWEQKNRRKCINCIRYGNFWEKVDERPLKTLVFTALGSKAVFSHCIYQSCRDLISPLLHVKPFFFLIPLSINPSYHIVSPVSKESSLISTLDTRDFSCAISGCGQVFIMPRRSWFRLLTEDLSACVRHRSIPLSTIKLLWFSGYFLRGF